MDVMGKWIKGYQGAARCGLRGHRSRCGFGWSLGQMDASPSGRSGSGGGGGDVHGDVHQSDIMTSEIHSDSDDASDQIQLRLDHESHSYLASSKRSLFMCTINTCAS